jgi:hypothetical protein
MKKTNKLLPAKSVEKKALGGIIAATATNVIPGLIGGIFNNIAKRRAELRAEKDLMEQQILNSQPEQFRKGGRIYEYPGGGYVYIDDPSFYGVDEKGNAITEGYNLGQAGDGTYDRGRTIPALNKDLSKGIPDNKVIPLTTGKELLGYDEKGKPVYVGYEYPSIKPIKPAITAATVDKNELVELDELVRENSNSKLSANDLKRYKTLKAKYPKESKRYEAAFSTLKDLNSETSSKNPTAKDILIGKATQTSVPKVSNPDAEAVEIGELYSLLDSYLTVGLNQKDLKRFKELKEMYPSDYEDSEKTIAQTKGLKTEVQNLEQQVYNNAFNENGYYLDDALLEDYVVKYKKLYSQEPDIKEILKERQRQANYREANEKSKWISPFVNLTPIRSTTPKENSTLKQEVQNLEQQVYNNAFNQNGYYLDDALLEDYVVKYKKLYSQEPDIKEILKERQRQANYREVNEGSKWISPFVTSDNKKIKGSTNSADSKSKLKTEVQNLEQRVYNNAFNQNGYYLDDMLLEEYVVKYKQLYSQEPDIKEILKERQRQANYKENNEKSKWISPFVPSPFPIGGYVNSPIQAEEFEGQKETIALPDDQLIETNAEAPHEQMPDQQITDVLPENSYVFSARNKLSAKTAMQLLLELGMDKKDVNKLKGKKEISPVDVSNLAKPTKNTANDYQTSELKERNRQAVLEKAKTFNELLKVLNPEEQPQMAGGGSLLNPNTYSPFAIPQIAMPTFNPNLNTTFTGKDYFTQRTPQISPFVNYQVPDVSLNYQNTPNSYNPFATAKMDLKTGIFPKPTTNYFGGSPYADSIAEKRANADLEAYESYMLNNDNSFNMSYSDSIAEKRANADLERYESSLLNDSTAMAERDLAWKRAQLDSASGFKGNSEKPFMKIPENRSNQNKMFSDKDLTLFAGNLASNLVSGLGTMSQQMYRTVPTNLAPILNMNTEPEYSGALQQLLQSQRMGTDAILNSSYNPTVSMANATNTAANTQSSVGQYMGQVAAQRQQLQNQKLESLQQLLSQQQSKNQNIERDRTSLGNLKRTYPGELSKHTARDISNYVLDKDKKQAQMNQDRAILEMMMKLYNNPAITDLLDKAKNTVWGNK